MAELSKTHYSVDDFNFAFGLSQTEQRRIKKQRMKKMTKGRKGKSARPTPKESSSDTQLKKEFVKKINQDIQTFGSRVKLPAPPNKISHIYAVSYVRGSYRNDMRLIESIKKGNAIFNHPKIKGSVNLTEHWYGFLRSHFNRLLDDCVYNSKDFASFSRKFRKMLNMVVEYSQDNNKPAYNIVKYILFG